MTASAPYKSVSTDIDVQTIHGVDVGETPWLVCRSPNTTQGWRPISVKIQPKLIPASGINGIARPARANHLDFGVRPFRVAHNAHSANTDASSPTPIINRNIQ